MGKKPYTGDPYGGDPFDAPDYHLPGEQSQFESPHFPRPVASPPAPKKGGILDMLDQLAGIFVGRKTEQPRLDPTPEPYIDSSPQAPPYAKPLPASPNRHQFEVQAVLINATTTEATLLARVRPEYWTIYMRPTAGTPSAQDGVYVSFAGETVLVPAAAGLIAGQPYNLPVWVPANLPVYLPAPEMYISILRGGALDATVFVIACANVPYMFQ